MLFYPRWKTNSALPNHLAGFQGHYEAWEKEGKWKEGRWEKATLKRISGYDLALQSLAKLRCDQRVSYRIHFESFI